MADLVAVKTIPDPEPGSKPTQEEESLPPSPSPGPGDTPSPSPGPGDAPSLTTSYASFSEFQSQVQLCPDDLIKGKDLEKGQGGKETKIKEVKVYTGIKKYGGMLLTLFASICFSFAVLFVKYLKDYGFDAYGASFWRYAGITVPTIPLLMYYECGPGKGSRKDGASIFTTVWPVFKDDNWKTWLGLLSRGLIGSSSVILRYYALQYLTIGDTSVITYSTPVLVTVMAHFLLKERCGIVQIVIAFTTLAGVIIVTKPPLLTGKESFDTGTLIGTGLAVGSLVCSSLIVILTRMIREVHFALMTMVFGVIGVVQALVLSQTFGHFNIPVELTDTLLVVGLAVLSSMGQMAIILALKFEQAGPVSLIRSCDVIFGFLLQFFFLGVVPDTWSSLGAVIVLFGIVVTATRKWISTLPDEDSRKQTWSCLLK